MEPCFVLTTITVQGEEQEVFEVFADEARAQTIGFVFDEGDARRLFYAVKMEAVVKGFLSEWDDMGCCHEFDAECPACQARALLNEDADGDLKGGQA